MKKTISLTICSLLVCTLNAQIVTNELPYGLDVTNNLNIKKQGTQSVITLSVSEIAIIAQEDSINDTQPGPVRYAYPRPVNYTLEDSGVWQELEDGSKIWRLKVRLPGALSTNTYYDKFWLPDGAKFFVYSEETNQYIGAVTSEYIEVNRNEPIAFATAIIYGEDVVFEYYQPAFVKESAIISISRIDYGYRYVKNPYSSSGNVLQNFGDAGNCQVNINCSEGNNWQTEKHAVARISIPTSTGTGWCSCALINNTNNDYTPYILTANHCLSGLDAINNNNAGQWTFYWEYEHPICANSSTQPILRTTTGATVKANNSISDFALLQLTQDPRNVSGVTPYYLGWDRSDNASTGGVGIHHPRGDVKKISTHNIVPYTSNCFTSTDYSNNNFWKVNWMSTTNGHSVTEGGSSGSPLINNDHRVIGQLFGAGNTNICPNPNCSNPSADIANYGKFSVSWTGSTTTNNEASDNRRKLRSWLDPAGTNPQTLNGIAYNPSTISGASKICVGSSATYTVNNAPSGFTWSCSSNLTKTSQSGNTATFSANSNGTGSVSILVGNAIIVSKTVKLGTPAGYIAGPYDLSCNCQVTISQPGNYRFSAINLSESVSSNNINWEVIPSNPDLFTCLYAGANPVINFSESGNYIIKMRWNGTCGYSPYTTKTIYVPENMYSSYSAAYPNPAGNELIIDRETNNNEIAATNAIENRQNAQATNTTVKVLLYSHSTTQLVYSKDFSASEQQIKIDTSKLPNGIYYLNIIANGEKVKQQTIVVNH
jgi:hypothetical protein